MSKHEAMKYWLRSAKRDRNVALDMFKDGHYNWSLFMWQLVIERLLKALIIKFDKDVLYTHDLLHLAKSLELVLTPQQKKHLIKITSFNLEARYEDYKEKFYHEATKSFCQEWSNNAEGLYQWLSKQI